MSEGQKKILNRGAPRLSKGFESQGSEPVASSSRVRMSPNIGVVATRPEAALKAVDGVIAAHADLLPERSLPETELAPEVIPGTDAL